MFDTGTIKLIDNQERLPTVQEKANNFESTEELIQGSVVMLVKLEGGSEI